MAEQIEEEITVTGSLFSVSLFEQKLMKNFLLISNKLRKLEGVLDLDQKTKVLEKQFKFLTMKVETILQKLPKDGGSVNRNDVKLIVKDQIIEVLNSSDEKITKTKYHQHVLGEIAKLKQQLSKIGGHHPTGNHNSNLNSKDKKDGGPRTSFTAGQIMRDAEKDKSSKQVSKQTLKEVLDDKQMEIVNNIISENQQKPEINQHQVSINDLTSKFDQLTKIVEQLRLGRGYASFLEREAEKFQKFEQFQEKSRQTTRKIREKPIQLQGIKQQNARVQVLKSGLYTELQRMQLNKQQIAKQQLMQKKTIYLNPLNKQKQSVRQPFKDGRDLKQGREASMKIKDAKEGKQIKQISIKEKKRQEQSGGFRRSQSIKKIDRVQKRLKVDDFKQLNGVLRQIQLRIQGKVSHDIFMGFIKDFQQKLQIMRLSRDTGAQINELRRNIFVLESKLQSVISYLQSIAQQDEALLVKKQWTCVSCDKGLQKYQGKVGQHLNWDTVASKKISPTKIGAFGQTGQLATKIRNLMDGGDGEE